MSNQAHDIRQAVLGLEIDGNRFPELMPMLLERQPGDITVLGAVRYLFHKRLWNFQDPEGKEVLARFYGPSMGGTGLSPEDYIALTREAILTDYGYHIPQPEAYVPPPRENRPQRDFGKPQRKAKRPAVERHESDGKGGTRITNLGGEGESGSREFKSLRDHDVDTTGASERLKKVIGIQRGG